MTLFWHQTGPKVQYTDGMLIVSDLNPEVHTQWMMTGFEMFVLGLRCIVSAIRQ